MELNKIQQTDYLDIVFEGRNQAYGAYELRKNYQKTVKRAIIFGGSLFLMLLLVPFYAFTNKVEGKPTICFPTEWENIPKPKNEIKKPALPKKEVLKKPELPVVVLPVKSLIFEVPKVVEDNLSLSTPPKIADFDDAVAAQTTNKTGESGGAAPAVLAPKGEAANFTPIIKEDETKDNEILIFTQIRAEFPGGERALMQWLADRITYPTMARETGLEGKVFLTFVIEKNGEITDIRVHRGIGSGCDEAATSAVEQMPRWSPAKQNGRAVRVQFNLPVQFRLD